MKKPKIVLVSDKLPPNIGGMESHAYEFIRYFSSDPDFDFISAFTFKKGQVPDSLSAKEGHIDPVLLKYVKPSLTYNSINNPKELRSELEKIGFAEGDVIFFNSLYWIRALPFLRESFPEAKIILRSGGNDILQSQITGKGDTLNQRRQFVVGVINQALDKLVINSSYTYNQFIDLGISKSVMQKSTGGVDIKRFYPLSHSEKRSVRKSYRVSGDKKVILASTRLVSFKGFPYALNAIEKLIADTYVPFHYLIVGDGPERKSILRSMRKQNLEDYVSLNGAVNFIDMADYFKMSDIYFHMPLEESRKVDGGKYIHTETMGRSFCEAAASALPSVSTDVGGVSDVVIQDKTGLLVPQNDSQSAAHEIKKLLEDDTYRQDLGKRARFHAEKFFSWDVLFNSYKEMFR